MLVHAKDDPHVPYEGSEHFARAPGALLKPVNQGGHLRTEEVVRKYWTQIERFFESE